MCNSRVGWEVSAWDAATPEDRGQFIDSLLKRTSRRYGVLFR